MNVFNDDLKPGGGELAGIAGCLRPEQIIYAPPKRQPAPRARSARTRPRGEFREVAELARLADAGLLGIDAAVLRTPYTADTALEPLTRALAQIRGELD